MKALRAATLGAAMALVLSPLQALADPDGNQEIKYDNRTLKACFLDENDSEVNISIVLDELWLRNGTDHSVFYKPESHKLQKDSFSGRLTCPKISGPGVKFIGGGKVSVTVDCDYKWPRNGDAKYETSVVMVRNGPACDVPE
ncbi:hypothetical protein [Ferrimonas marina]|uniref:Uncharacterized protein n=1 Tax=Ferrimonas marina TaxID=299255 RepID=A0A1M5X7A2_9GAMM|nr:hypothetical protein [Ferrimonas marina]SHH95669.1 hypothetical protein SAMN02745129_3292 [Ferrimonas marina]